MLRFVASGGMLLTALLAGCLGLPDDAHEYHFAYVAAEFTETPPGGWPDDVACTLALPVGPDVDEARRALTFHALPDNAPDGLDPERLHGLILLVTMTHGPCDGVVVDAFPFYGSATALDVPLLGGETLRLELLEDGSVVVGEGDGATTLAPGEDRAGAYTAARPGGGSLEGSFVVKAMGNWDPADITLPEPADGGDGGDDRHTSYVFAWITGNFTATGPGGEGMVGICGWPSEPTVDEEAQTITFHEAGREAVEGRDVTGLRGLVLLTQWDRSGCGVLVTRVGTVWNAEEPNVELELLGGVVLGLRLNGQDGSVVLHQDETPQEDARVLQPGERHRGAYAGQGEDGSTWEGDYVLRAMGHWPGPGVRVTESP